MSSKSTTEEEKFEYHEPCPICGSSDGCAHYRDGHRYCFVCHTYFPAATKKNNHDSKSISNTATTTNSKAATMIPLDELTLSDIPARKLTRETCAKYKYFTGVYQNRPCQVACYFDKTGELVGQKIRFPNKDFKILGKISHQLYGANLWHNDRMIVITEGEIDCLSVSQMQENKYPVVSIPNGAPAAKRAIEENLEYLSNYNKIILMFDMDEPGRKAVEECAKILPIGKAFVANLPLKDANECLKANRVSDVIQAIWNAQPYRPDGIVAGTELHEQCVEEAEELTQSIPYPWAALQDKTLGIRFGELYVLTSGSGMGKSTLMRELEYYLGVTQNERCGIIALEESTRKTGLELMSLYVNKRLAIDPTVIDEATRDEAFRKTIGNGNFYLYDHFGSIDSSNLMNKIRFMVVSLGCKRIFLDHISIVVSGMDNTTDGGERKAIDKLMTNLRTLVEETGCTMYVISHLKRPSNEDYHEEGGHVSLGQLRGSGAIAQLSDIVIGLERNQQGKNPNHLTIRILKNRFSGDTGIGGYLEYNPDTGRLSDSTAEMFTNEEEQPKKENKDAKF